MFKKGIGWVICTTCFVLSGCTHNYYQCGAGHTHGSRYIITQPESPTEKTVIYRVH